MAKHAGASRFIWNRGLAYLNERREKGEKHVGFMTKEIGLAAMFTLWRADEELLWLKELSSLSMRYSLQRLDTAYRHAFQRLKKKQEAGFPKFHAKKTDESFTIPQNISFALGEQHIRLEKIGWVRMRPNRGRGSCAVEGLPKMVIIKREGKKWFACVQCVIADYERPIHHGASIGLDLGVKRAVTDSNGGHHDLPINDKLEARRRRYQRIMSRRRDAALRKVGWDGKSNTQKTAESKLGKQRKAKMAEGAPLAPKYSRRYEIAKMRCAKTTRKLFNIRANALHQISSAITKEHALIVVENLAIKNMTATAKGDAENPGTNVRAKAGLNRAILARGWGNLRGMLEYKSDWRGGYVARISPQYTSQKCFQCGHIAKENRKTQEKFICEKCGHRDNADINAAKNILAAHGERASADADKAKVRAISRPPVESATSTSSWTETSITQSQRSAEADLSPKSKDYPKVLRTEC